MSVFIRRYLDIMRPQEVPDQVLPGLFPRLKRAVISGNANFTKEEVLRIRQELLQLKRNLSSLPTYNDKEYAAIINPWIHSAIETLKLLTPSDITPLARYYIVKGYRQRKLTRFFDDEKILKMMFKAEEHTFKPDILELCENVEGKYTRENQVKVFPTADPNRPLFKNTQSLFIDMGLKSQYLHTSMSKFANAMDDFWSKVNKNMNPFSPSGRTSQYNVFSDNVLTDSHNSM